MTESFLMRGTSSRPAGTNADPGMRRGSFGQWIPGAKRFSRVVGAGKRATLVARSSRALRGFAMRRFTTDPTPVLCRLAAAALLALTAIIPVFAESSSDTGTIVGTVTDSLRGLPMPDASVIVLGHRRGAMTDTAGMFRIRNVPVGIQTVRVLSIGNDPALRTVTVRANEETRVSFAILRAWLGDSEADDVPIPPARRDVRVRCTIRPTKQVFRVGERPTFDVRIVNDGRDTVLLVRSLDGSERGRSPQVNLEVAGPGFEKPALIYCGNQNSL